MERTTYKLTALTKEVEAMKQKATERMTAAENKTERISKAIFELFANRRELVKVKSNEVIVNGEDSGETETRTVYRIKDDVNGTCTAGWIVHFELHESKVEAYFFYTTRNANLAFDQFNNAPVG